LARQALELALDPVAQRILAEAENVRALDAVQPNYGPDAKVDGAGNELRQDQKSEVVTAMLSREPTGTTALFAAARPDIRHQPKIQNLVRAPLRAMEEENERVVATESAISAAIVLRSQGNFPGALQPLDAFLAKYGANRAIDDLRETILKELEAAGRADLVRSFAQQAKDLISRGHYEDAASLLRGAPRHVLDQPEFGQLGDCLQLHLRQAERVAATRQLPERAKAVLSRIGRAGRAATARSAAFFGRHRIRRLRERLKTLVPLRPLSNVCRTWR
jgi:hypothetical protein